MDEAALTGMTLTASPPTLERSEEACAAAADELSALGACAHARPEPLHVKTIGRRRFGRLVYERLTFEHDPLLPPSLAGSGLGGPTTAAVHLCRQGDDRRPWLVWVHGAGQGQPLDLLFSRARRIQSELGFNIALPVQPGHGVRREAWPAYPNMDPLANVAGMMRAVSEVRAVVRWLQPGFHRHRGFRCVDGQSGRGTGVAPRDGGCGRGLYPDLRAQRDDRSAPRPVGPVGPRRRRCTAIGDCRAVGVTGRSAGCRADAAA